MIGFYILFYKQLTNNDRVKSSKEKVNLAYKLFCRHNDKVSREDFNTYIGHHAETKAEEIILEKKRSLKIYSQLWRYAEENIYNELEERSIRYDEEFFYINPSELLTIMHKHFEIEDDLFERIGLKAYQESKLMY